jgi:hypothetical protein
MTDADGSAAIRLEQQPIALDRRRRPLLDRTTLVPDFLAVTRPVPMTRNPELQIVSANSFRDDHELLAAARYGGAPHQEEQ